MEMMRLHFFAAPAAFAIACTLAGCATKPVTVKVPVSVPCVGAVPDRPGSTFGAGKWPGDKAAAQATLIDAALWQGYATKLEVVVAGCR
jgi:hypothetical protein